MINCALQYLAIMQWSSNSRLNGTPTVVTLITCKIITFVGAKGEMFSCSSLFINGMDTKTCTYISNYINKLYTGTYRN